MDQNAKSAIKIIFKQDQFIIVGGRKALTTSRTLSYRHPIRHHAIHHQLVERRLLLTELTHSSTRLSSRDALLELLWLLLGAISPIQGMVGDYELTVAKMAEQLPGDVVRAQGRR